MSAPIDYRGWPRMPIRRRQSPHGIAAIVFFGAAAGMTVFGVAIMDAERLLWEGGGEYFLHHFPYLSVWTLCSIGAGFGVAGLGRRGRAKDLAVWGLVLNLLCAGYFARNYVVNRRAEIQRGGAGTGTRLPSW